MGSGEEIQLPALWICGPPFPSFPPFLPILSPFPQLPVSPLPFSSPFCFLFSEFLGEKGSKWGTSNLQTYSFLYS